MKELDWKKDEVSQLQDFVKSSDVVGLVDVTGIGAKQMLDMRASLRNLGVKLRMSRNRLLKRALETSSKDKKGVEIKSSNDLAMYLLEDAKISLVPGEDFGAPNCIRLSYAASESDLIEACKRMNRSIQKLN